METVQRLLESPAVLELLAAVIVVVWALPRVRAWREQVRQALGDQVYELAVQAATETYHGYVEGLKAGRADGKLDLEESRAARRKAVARLWELIEGEGLGRKVPGDEASLEATVELAVAGLKKQGVLP